MSIVIHDLRRSRTRAYESLAQRLLVVAWMSILVGLLMELLMAFFAAASGRSSYVEPIMVAAAQKVSWSMFICAGLALGTASAKGVRTQLSAALGFFGAPVAFMIAKIVHRSLSQHLGLETGSAPVAGVVMLIKAVEYGSLGAIAGWLSMRPWAGIRVHALAGLITGFVFGGSLIGYTLATATTFPTALELTGVALNELIYPTACAVILFAASALGNRLAE